MLFQPSLHFTSIFFPFIMRSRVACVAGRPAVSNAYESWCFLMAEPNERLKFLTSTNDGFLVAQKDMELRGPGELFGTRQSGSIAEGVSLYGSDAELLKCTHDLARELLADPESDDARAVIALAKARFADRLNGIAAN